MIVRNEEEALERCLLSVEGVADEIIIVDTGSTDRTKEIAGRFTGRIYDFDWVDDFAAARNYAFGKATESYIMWLDADDVVEEPCGFKWIGVVHEYLEVAGNIVQRDIAITHKKDKAYTDRNLQIYRRRLEQGEEFLPRDMYYFANELNDHGWFEEAADQYEKFLATKQGWIEDQIAACLKLADCCARLYERDRQLRSLFRTMEYDRPRADCCCRLGALFMSENRLQEAIYWYETATTLGEPPQSGALIDHASWTWLPHLQLCVCYDKLGQYKKAYEYNERALDYQPDHPSMLYNKRYLEEQLKERAGG
ncbi:glycosyltransferase [Paenibacillus mendelii]|nr:glycosyltransferase [Paenibacillus mendelii]